MSWSVLLADEHLNAKIHTAEKEEPYLMAVRIRNDEKAWKELKNEKFKQDGEGE